MNSGPGFYYGYYTGYYTGYYGSYGLAPSATGPGGGSPPGQILAYANGAPEAAAYAEGFTTGAYGPGIPAPGNGGLFNAGAAVDSSTYPSTRDELEIPVGIGPSTNPTANGGNNYQQVQQQGNNGATPVESNAANPGGQREGDAPQRGGSPADGSPNNPDSNPTDQRPGTGGGHDASNGPQIEAADPSDSEGIEFEEFTIIIVPSVGEWAFNPKVVNGKTFEFHIPAVGYNGGDFALADEIAKAIDPSFAGSNRLRKEQLGITKALIPIQAPS